LLKVTSDLRFLSFGHAIRYHPPPQRNDHATMRKAPFTDDCALSGRIYSTSFVPVMR
jgi:hypothetical protein